MSTKLKERLEREGVVGLPQRSGGERSEPERSGGSPTTRAATTPSPDPEVTEKPTRRRFTADYKLRVLLEADACRNDGDVGRLLRREGLYSSHLAAWRRQRKDGGLKALAPRQRGPRSKKNDPLARRNAELERENRRLRRRLEQAETIIDIQKKASALLGIPLNHPASDEND